MNFRKNGGSLSVDEPGHEFRNWAAEYDGSQQHLERHSVFGIVTTVLQYLLAVPVALLAAIAAGLMGGVAGGVVATGCVELYKLVVTIPPEAYRYGSYHPGFSAFIETVWFVAASFSSTFVFCLVALKMCPLKNQIQSVVVLEMVALIWIVFLAGENTGSEDYGQMFVALSAVLAIALLVLKWPHWVYLCSRTRSRGAAA